MAMKYTPAAVTAQLTPSGSSPACAECHGTGKIEVTKLIDGQDESYFKECRCAYEAKIRARIGAEIWNAPIIERTELIYRDASGVVINRARESLWITRDWDVFASHLRLVLLKHLNVYGPGWTFMVTSDVDIREAFLADGSEGDHHKDEDPTPAGLTQFIKPSFLVIQLGLAGYKNQALPGLIYEVIRRRHKDAAKAADTSANTKNPPPKTTWIVDEPDSPWEAGHFAWNKVTAQFVEKHFGRLVFDDTDDIVAKVLDETAL